MKLACRDNRRAARFLSLMREMDDLCRRRFVRIYRLAPQDRAARSQGFSGRHVRLAMIEALRHPQIAFWVRLNLAVRVTKKLYEAADAHGAGLAGKIRQLENILEDFHVAAEAFANGLSIDDAVRNRERQRRASAFLRPALSLTSRDKTIPGEDVEQIREFKRRIIPGLVQGIRLRLSAN